MGAAVRLFGATRSPAPRPLSGRCLITNEFLNFSTGYSSACHEITAAASESASPAKNSGHHDSPVMVRGKVWISNWRKGVW